MQEFIERREDSIDLRGLCSLMWKSKLSIVLSILMIGTISIVYSAGLPNVYKSDVLLSPSSDSGKLSMPGQLGGLAALAGVNLSGGGSNDKTNLALEIIKSKDFITRFIEENDIYVELMASTGWDMINNRLIIDHNLYNIETAQWVRDVEYPRYAKPSKQEAFEAFQKLFSITQNKNSGTITLSIEFYSPYIAKAWLDKLVVMINEDMRTRDLAEAERSIAYLNKEINKTNVSELKSTLYSLIEEQTKTLTLANVRSEYVFMVIDPPLVPEIKHSPKRALIVAVCIILAFFLSVFVVLVRYSVEKKKTSANGA